jgi:seryl-tRNA synthetase
MPPVDEAHQAFHDELVRHRLIIASDVPGIWGRSATFEDVLNRFNAFVTAAAASDGAEQVHFPPVISRRLLERSEYLDSFPQLAGTVFSFTGDEGQARELSRCAHEGEGWSRLQSQTDVVLIPAACYPIYPTFRGVMPDAGRSVDMWSYCFRHEPSMDPARMQMFRVREFVRAGSQQMVLDWRARWLERGLTLLRSLGLDAEAEAASDPFFGRAGRMLAANQREQGFKFEVLVPISSTEHRTAVCSFNYHQDHFGQLFDIRQSNGEPAQTACLGFGLERVTLALFKQHGFDVREWPAPVRTALWS